MSRADTISKILQDIAFTVIKYDHHVLKGTVQSTFEYKDIVCMVEYQKDFVLAFKNGNIGIFDYINLFTFKTKRQITSLAILKGYLIVSGSHDGNIDIWNNKGEIVMSITAHERAINCISILSESKIVTGSNDGQLCIWNYPSKKCEHSFKHSHTVLCTAILRTTHGDRVVCGLSNGVIEVWNVYKGVRIHAFVGHKGKVNCITVIHIRKQTTIVSGGIDGFIRLWNSVSWVEQFILHDKLPILGVGILSDYTVISSNGHHLKIGDKTILLDSISTFIVLSNGKVFIALPKNIKLIS